MNSGDKCYSCYYLFELRGLGNPSASGRHVTLRLCLASGVDLSDRGICQVHECTKHKDINEGTVNHLKDMILKMGGGVPTAFEWDRLLHVAENARGGV